MNTELERGVKKSREGLVVSSKMDKTIVVKTTRRVRHPVYGKEMTASRKFYAHDEKNDAKEGDRVRIEETRPLSKLKCWRLVEVLERAEARA